MSEKPDAPLADEPETAAPPAAADWLVATERLTIGGVLAFAVGHKVPAEHVERFGWQDKVRAPDPEPDVSEE